MMVKDFGKVISPSHYIHSEELILFLFSVLPKLFDDMRHLFFFIYYYFDIILIVQPDRPSYL